MKKIRYISSIVAAGIFLSLSLVACSSGGARRVLPEGQSSPIYETGAAGEADYEIADEAAKENESGLGEVSGLHSEGSNPLAGRKLITTGNINIETKTFDETLSVITNSVNSLGGYFENSTIHQQDVYYNSYYYDLPDDNRERRVAELTARVPSDRYAEFLNTLQSVGKTTYFSENKRDITLEYTDVELHKKSLLVEQERLLSLLENAQEIEDIFTIESRLSEIRYAIESYESDLRLFDNQVDFSTIYISLYEVITFTEVKTETLGTRIANRFQESLVAVRVFLTEALLDFIGLLPFLVLIAVAFAVLFFIIRALIRMDMRHRAKKMAEKDKEIDKTPHEKRE